VPQATAASFNQPHPHLPPTDTDRLFSYQLSAPGPCLVAHTPQLDVHENFAAAGFGPCFCVSSRCTQWWLVNRLYRLMTLLLLCFLFFFLQSSLGATTARCSLCWAATAAPQTAASQTQLQQQMRNSAWALQEPPATSPHAQTAAAQASRAPQRARTPAQQLQETPMQDMAMVSTASTANTFSTAAMQEGMKQSGSGCTDW
jgi:hypothetical protein